MNSVKNLSILLQLYEILWNIVWTLVNKTSLCIISIFLPQFVFSSRYTFSSSISFLENALGGYFRVLKFFVFGIPSLP